MYYQKMLRILKILELFKQNKPTMLGRWSLKSCEDIKSATNSVYKNRDHCGDLICKTPKRVSEYLKLPNERIKNN